MLMLPRERRAHRAHRELFPMQVPTAFPMLFPIMVRMQVPMAVLKDLWAGHLQKISCLMPQRLMT